MLVLVDVSHVWHQSRLDPEILKLLQLHADTPSILVLNKVQSGVSQCLMGLDLCNLTLCVGNGSQPIKDPV